MGSLQYSNIVYAFLVLYFCFGPGVLSKTICIELVARFGHASPDGVLKEIITINGQFPGPTIRAARGDILNIRVRNLLLDSSGVMHPTSVHFHGIEMRHTPWFDGPEQVTQCPIPYKGYMDYSFKLVQSGTYWYHSHHAWQYIDGFWGLLIVENSPAMTEVHSYNDEFSITLMDWHHRSGEVLSKLLHLPRTNPHPEAGRVPLPDSALLNGRGNADCLQVATNNNLQCDETKTRSITIFRVVPGWTYRIRVVNPSAHASFNFSIDGHRLKAIEVDGVDTVETSPVDAVTIWPAQRYSFLVTMDWNVQFNPFGGKFWVRADLNIDGPSAPNPINAPYAAIYYIGSNPPRSRKGLEGFDERANATAILLELNKMPNRADIKGSIGGGIQGRPSSRKESVEMMLSIDAQSEKESAFLFEPIFQKENDTDTVGKRPGHISSSGFQTGSLLPLSCRAVGLTKPTVNSNTHEVILFNYEYFSVWSNRQPNPNILDQSNCKSMKMAGFLDPAPQSFNQEKKLSATFGFENNVLKAYMNGVTYNSAGSQIPVIFSAMLNLPIPPSFVPIETPDLEMVVQLIINNDNDGAHPWHLHGHTFWVMATGEAGDGPYNPAIHSWKLNVNNGLRRDTTHTPRRSWTVVRFETGNPGAWLLHCHIHWHLEMGLGAVFIEGRHELQTSLSVPREARRVCRQNGLIIPGQIF
ncbi:unnamed protein product [Orchesella dallaii]|uniref:Uncharacterized protein n=1 Tax=Orchesella dallaii TaxID=48710 RepID=A0ABP1QD84_9HEXA